jgi:retron-type reverse transcriptase
MPCDTLYDQNNIDEFKDILNEVNQLSIIHNPDHIICAGDFNTDFTRLNSLHTRALCSFLNDENLCTLHDLHMYDVPYTFESKANGCRSSIDHFFVNRELHDAARKVYVSHSIDNMSDHIPLHAHFEIPISYRSHRLTQAKSAKQLWAKASPECISLYSHRLENCLHDIELPLAAIQCTNTLCTDRQHTADLQSFHDRLVEGCLEASSCIPKSRTSTRNVPGWNECVKPVLQKALFWHKLWVQNGRPQHGAVADVRRFTRAQYHKAVKHVKSIGQSLQFAKMGERFAFGEKREFWNDIAKMRSKGSPLPTSVDGIVGDDGIAQMFGHRYSALYNSVGYDKDSINRINNNINSCIENHIGDCCAHSIESEDVTFSIKNLKRNKHDGMKGLYSDHLKNAPQALHHHLATLFKSCIIHGFSPSEFGKSVMIPIPKDKSKSKSDPGNYRSIALSSILNKVLDKIIIKKCQAELATSDYQFGFKAKHSTAQCSFVVNEVVQHYVNGQNPVYACLLDASKAFDRIAYCRLFRVLVEKSMCPLIIRFLLHLYTNQSASVRWGQSLSNQFNISNGVKQGGVISPILFTLYFDILLTRLVQSKLGCQLGSRPMGAFAYADDVILLSPSVEALKSMLRICEDYGHEFDVQFNPTKSKIIAINGNHIINHIPFMTGTIEIVNHERHLGIKFGNVGQNEIIESMITQMNKNTNMILSHFRLLPPNVSYSLFKTYCMPLYGCQLLDLDDPAIMKLLTNWRKCIRAVLKLPLRTHSKLLHLICDDYKIEMQLYSRFAKFFRNAANSRNQNISVCAMMALNGSGSRISNSLSVVSHFFNCSRFAITQKIPSMVDFTSDDEDDIVISKFIQNVLDDRWFLSIFPYHSSSTGLPNTVELTEILNDICT